MWKWWTLKKLNRESASFFGWNLFVNQKKKQTVFTFRHDVLFIKSVHVNKITITWNEIKIQLLEKYISTFLGNYWPQK